MRNKISTLCFPSAKFLVYSLPMFLLFFYVLWCLSVKDDSENGLGCLSFKDKFQQRSTEVSLNFEQPVLKKSFCNYTTVHLSFMVGGAKSTRQAMALIKSIIYQLKPDYKCSTTPQTQFLQSLHQIEAILTFHFIVDQAARISLQSIFQSWQLNGIMYYFYDFEQFKNIVNWIPSAHYSGYFGSGKLLLSEILPTTLQKVINLDVDMLLNADIRELWEHFDHFTSRQMIGMTSNQSPWYTLRTSWPAIGHGFNTGLMLLDLTKMRKARWKDLWPIIAKEQLKIRKRVDLSDQDIINAVLVQNQDYVYSVPCSWNVQLNDWNEPLRCQLQQNNKTAVKIKENLTIQQMVSNIKIAHFNSPQKPEDLIPGQVPKGETKQMPEEKRHLRQWFNSRYHMFQEYDGRWIKEKMASLQSRNFSSNIFHFVSEPSNCSEFEANRHIKRRIHPFYLSYEFSDETNGKLLNEVTLISQLSFDRIYRLEQLVSNWPGPVSLALYLSDLEAHKLPAIVQQSSVLSKRKNIGFHIVFSEGTFYPINELRNVALKFARTDLVFHLDVDFIPSSNLYENIKNIVKERRKTNKNEVSGLIESNTGETNVTKDCFVVPAFETFDLRLTIPSTKQELLDKLNQNIVVPFRHQVWTRGHLATNYTRWRSATEPYQVQWSADYEPYVVTYRNAPALDSNFVGFGWNKASYIMSLDALGYRFFVLSDAFVLHLPHPPSIEIMRYRSSPQYRYCVDKMKLDFIKELAKQHGVQALKYLEFRKEEQE